MPRLVRGFCSGQVYHVGNRGNDGQQIFKNDYDYRAFLDILKDARSLFSVRIYCYCLAIDHFHLVLEPERGEGVSSFMQWLMTCHVRRYHVHYGTSGHVWQGRYKSCIVKPDCHLLKMASFVESNPVRRGLVKRAEEWVWSSHRENIGDRLCTLTDRIPVDLPKNWNEVVNSPMKDEDCMVIRQCIARQAPYGDSEWQAHTCKLLGLESTIRKRGRPRNESNKIEPAPFF